MSMTGCFLLEWRGNGMLRIEGTSIQLTRGDTTRLKMRLTGRELPEGCTALFTVKRGAWRHGEAVIQKLIPVTDDTVSVMLSAEETEIEPGHYAWDVRINEPYEGGENRFTPMAYGGLDVLEAIGDE